MVLGKGLSVLLGEEDLIDVAISRLSVHVLHPNPKQPRRSFPQEAMDELCASIREKGVLQPLIVRKIDGHSYQIIAGERRFRAAKNAGLSDVPVVIVDCNDEEALEIGLIENLQRENLNPIEEAMSLESLMKHHHKTQEEMAKTLGKSRSYIANTVRLINLPDEVKELIEQKKISPGHARCLLGIENACDIAREIVEKDLSVREVEQLIRSRKRDTAKDLSKEGSITQTITQEQEDIEMLAGKISRLLNIPSRLNINKQKKAILTLEFDSWDKLDHLCQLLQKNSITS